MTIAAVNSSAVFDFFKENCNGKIETKIKNILV